MVKTSGNADNNTQVPMLMLLQAFVLGCSTRVKMRPLQWKPEKLKAQFRFSRQQNHERKATTFVPPTRSLTSYLFYLLRPRVVIIVVSYAATLVSCHIHDMEVYTEDLCLKQSVSRSSPA